MDKCVIYVRVSSDRQIREGNGADSQEQRCRAYATAQGFEVLQVFRDEAVSGGLLDRPAINSLLLFLKKSKAEGKIAVIVDDISRIARDVSVHVQLRTLIKQSGGELRSPSFSFEDNAMGEMVELIYAAMAQYGRTGNREQVINRQKARLEQGFWCFQPPQGYVYDKHPVYKKWLVPKINSNILADGLERYARGTLETKRSLAEYLQASGFYPSGPDIIVLEKRITRIFELLPMYAGYLEYPNWGVNRVLAKHLPIITKDVFSRILEREKKGAGPLVRTGGTNDDFVLRGFVRCYECNKPLTASFAKGKYPRYHCYNQRCGQYGHGIKRDRLTDDFGNLLRSLEAKPELLQLIQILGKAEWERRIAQRSEGVVEHERESEKVAEELSVLSRRLGRTSDDEVAQILEEEIKLLKRKREEIIHRIDDFRKDPPSYVEAFRRVSTVIQNPFEYWSSGSLAQKKTVHRIVFTVPPSYNRDLGFSTLSLSLPYKITQDFKASQKEMVEVARVSLASRKVSLGILHAQSVLNSDSPGNDKRDGQSCR